MKRIARAPLATAVLLVLAAPSAAAQLRPLEPLPAGTFAPDARTMSLRAGFGVLADQRASLAGTEGTLTELGNLGLVWRTGRVAIEVAGTALRLFEDRSVFAEAGPSVDPEVGPRRRDVGDFRVATSVRLTPDAWAPVGFVRFGTRLPTTDDTVGLDRDRTDFFSTLGVQWAPRALRLAGEIGVGINGTHHQRLEQSDVLIYALAAEYTLGRFTPGALLVGHFDGMPGSIRGNEELSEIRLGGRFGDQLWISGHWVQGLADFSPARGVLVTAGWSR